MNQYDMETKSTPEAATDTVEGAGIKPLACQDTDAIPGQEWGGVDDHALQTMVRQLCDFRKHVGALETDSETIRHELHAICMVLVVGPQELGMEWTASPLLDRIRDILSSAVSDEVPEAQVCDLWLACAAGIAGEDAAERFAALAAQPLWEPVATLAWRALAFFGYRERLCTLLPPDGELSPWQADALLDASLPATYPADFCDHVATTSENLVSASLMNRWRVLIDQECRLARGGSEGVSESDLAQIAKACPDHAACDYEQAVARRLATRAVAALVRYRLGVKRGDEGALSAFPADLLPAWEHAYLRGLVCWLAGDLKAAGASLEKSLALNPNQTCVKLALAAIPGHFTATEALRVLGDAGGTRELCMARAAMLARLRRYEDAEKALQEAQADASLEEPIRFTWAGATEARRFRRDALQTALAEKRGEWTEAERYWRQAAKTGQRETLTLTRQLFAAARELQTAPRASESRRLERARRERDRLWHRIGAPPLSGSGSFFRGIVARDEHPDRARRDLRALLNRVAWVETEKRVGGGRLVAMGDGLAQLGCSDDAAKAYALAEEAGDSRAAARLALLRVCAAFGPQPENMATAVEEAAAIMTDSPWPFWLGAVGCLTEGDALSARKWTERAAALQTNNGLCDLLRRVADRIEGAPCSLPETAFRFLRSSALTQAMLRLLLSENDLASRLAAFLSVVGEQGMEYCPIDPGAVVAYRVSELCAQGEWQTADAVLESLAKTGAIADSFWKPYIRCRQALASALKGQLTEAEDLLENAIS
jgi:tetratricopeptide (TPR) repeat protein